MRDSSTRRALSRLAAPGAFNRRFALAAGQDCSVILQGWQRAINHGWRIPHLCIARDVSRILCESPLMVAGQFNVLREQRRDLLL